MNKTQIKAEIVADSINQQGDRLTSLLITFPRIILAELNTHRMLSKNTSSSRAIPFSKMVESIENDPFIPIAWQKNHKGMQGTEYITDKNIIESLEQSWLTSRNSAIHIAKKLNRAGDVTKQLCNRLLEPFMWTTMLITGSKEGWDNFFELRCPSYFINNTGQDYYFKSKKEAINFFGDEEAIDSLSSNKEVFLKNLSDLEWLQINKGQAEIHIMDLAEKIYDAFNESTPKQLEPGEWHIPFKDKLDTELSKWEFLPNIHELWGKDMSLYLVKVSTAMAARTSYTVVGDEKEIDYEKMIKLHDRLIEMRHDSPLEHCARAMSDEEYYSSVKTSNYPIIVPKTDEDFELNGGIVNSELYPQHEEYGKDIDKSMFGWCRNFKGFTQYRHFVELEKK